MQQTETDLVSESQGEQDEKNEIGVGEGEAESEVKVEDEATPVVTATATVTATNNHFPWWAVIFVGILLVVMGAWFLGQKIIDSNVDRNVEIEEVVFEEQNSEVLAQATETGKLNSQNIDLENKLLYPTLLEKVVGNGVWCGTFQLVWNDMQNEVVKRPIVFEPRQSRLAEYLNQQTFTSEMLEPEGYFKAYGLYTKKFVAEIRNQVKAKFPGEETPVLDELNPIVEDAELKECDNTWLFYAMLLKVFDFEKPFNVLNSQSFNWEVDKEGNYQYFGYDGGRKQEADVLDQVTVLFYRNEGDQAVKVATLSDDEIFLYRHDEGEELTFLEAWEEMGEKTAADLSTTEKAIKPENDDTFIMPNMGFNLTESFDNLEKKEFRTEEGCLAEIEMTIQNVTFDLNKKGGKVRSEAAMIVPISMGIIEENPQKRDFVYDQPFYLFVKEKGKELPYLAVRVEDGEFLVPAGQSD